MGRLTTHVLDTASGAPAAGMELELSVLEGSTWRKLKALKTNAAGRTDEPLLEGAALKAGEYRLTFDVSSYYYRRLGTVLANPPFLDRVPLRFGIADPAEHVHVPLLCTPWGYTTYKGS
jgi:5-hydroxyisourate hydrolase